MTTTRNPLIIASTLLLTMLPALAQEAPRDGIAGRWNLNHVQPGIVEMQNLHLLVRTGPGLAVSGDVSVPGISVPFAGTFDPATGKLALEAQRGSDTATISLFLRDGQLRGEGHLPYLPAGMYVTITGTRVRDEPTPPPEVDFSVRRPVESANGGLPASIAEASRSAIEEFMDTQATVGLSAALVANGEVVEVLSSGWEDFSQRVPASARTMYRWASVTKAITAVAAVQLEAAGELDLDADIRGLVPEYDKGVAISTRQLLTHRAGIPHYEQLQLRTRVEYDDPHPWADQIVALNMFVESDLVLPPGRGYHYSTPGYALLGAVIDRAGDDTYADQVIERICRPLGMSSMRPDYVWEEIPHRAAAYQSFGERALQTAPDDISWKLAAGGWISTVADMGRFAAGLMGPDLLDAETKEMMWSPPSNTGSGYAMGITVRDYRGQKMLTHGGGQIGATTFLLCNPESGYGVAIACNTEGIGNLPDLSLRLMILLIESKL